MKGQVKKNIKILYPELSYELNGIFFNVHRKEGRYCKEKQYADEIEKELNKKGIKYIRENRIYKEGEFTRNILDFIVNDCIVLEIKAKKFITKEDFYQTKRYLISTQKELGLIVNFRDDFIKTKRVLNECS
jgi:GxxExxY protein